MTDWSDLPVLLRERMVWQIEVGIRAALRTQYLPRDMRWWRGLWK